MDYWLILWNVLALAIYMSAAFAVAKKRGRLDTVDVAYGGGFVVAAAVTAGLFLNPRSLLILVLVIIWASRLANHIYERAKKADKDDPRYTEIATKWGKQNYWPRAYVSIFMLQAFVILLVSSPTLFAPNKPYSFWPLFAVVGAVVWTAGFATELIGDRQLRTFIGDKKNKGKVLETGLWRYTRHPNYLGEITQWYGIGIIACGVKFGWIGLIGPLALNVVIRFVSGVPPIEKRKGKDPAYHAYMQRTNAILPRFQRLAKDAEKPA